MASALHSKEWKPHNHINDALACSQHLANRLSPLEDFDNIAAATADQDRGISVAPLKSMMITIYNYLISEVYYRTGEEQQWNKEMTGLIDENIPENFLIKLQNHQPKMAARLGSEGMAEHFDLSQKCMSDWKLARMDYQREAKALEFAKPDTHVREFLAQYEPLSSSCSVGPILAAVQIGEINKVREILTKVSDEELFNDSADLKGEISRLYNPTGAEVALDLCWLALDWSRGCQVIEQIKKASPTFFDEAGPDHYERFWSRLATAGIILEQHGQIYESYSQLIKGDKFLETYRLQIANLQLRRYTFDSPAIEEMFPALIRLCMLAHKRKLPFETMGALPDNQHKHATSWKEHALLFLEQGRARTLLEVFETQAKENTTPNGRSTTSRD